MPTPIARTLRATADLYEEFARAASNYLRHKRWRKSSPYNVLPILDCDIFYRAATPLAVTSYFGSRVSEDVIIPEEEAISTHHRCRFLLRRLKHYCIPPGAEWELLRFRRMLRGRLSEHGERLIQTFDEALRSENPDLLTWV